MSKSTSFCKEMRSKYPEWNPPHCGVCLFWKYIHGTYGLCERGGKITEQRLGHCRFWELDSNKAKEQC